MIMIRLTARQGRALIMTAAPWKPLARSISLTAGRLADNDKEFRQSEDLAKERYDLRANEDIDRKRARLLYQSRKRGMLENGVILSSFADKYLDSFNAAELDEYDRLINLPTNDWDIFYWATKTKPTPPEFETAMMQKLRSHLNKKVSKNVVDSTEQKTSSILDGRRPDEVVFPAAKDYYELDIDPSAVDLVNYPGELFDNRTKSMRGGTSIEHMTEWRRKFFEKRLHRVISSPVSVRNLGDDKESPVWSQKAQDKNIASDKLHKNDLMDSDTERKIKHHNFVQYLLSHQFTDQLDEYEMEAEGWSNTLWLRDYGKSDVTIAPSEIKCTKCQVNLHCCDPGLDGYVPKELFAKLTIIPVDENQVSPSEFIECQRCNFSKTYRTNLDAQLEESRYAEMVKKFKDLKASVICLVVDLTDFPGGAMEGLVDLIGTKHKLVIVGNKLDLLPIDGRNIVERVTRCLRGNLTKLRPGSRNLFIHDVIVLSARTGFGVEMLVSKLITLTENPQDVYLLGCANSGKSTLFNALLQSDLSAVRDVDLLSRVSEEENILSSGISLLKFPISRPDGWEIELKRRRSERVLRNTTVLEGSLENTTKIRQATVPHMSMLIDRMGYPEIAAETADSERSALVGGSSSIEQQQRQLTTDVCPVNFSDDHPFRKIEQRDLFSATKENFPEYPFFYQTPSLLNCKDQLHDLLTNDERLEVFPHETMVPRQYTIRPLQSIFIAGLARLDLLTATSYITVTMFVSKYLPIHVISTRKADQFYDTFLGSPYLGVPFGDEKRLRAWPKLVSGGGDDDDDDDDCIHLRKAADIVLSSAGWALVEFGVDQECLIRAWTPEGRGICQRWPPLLAYASKLERGKKIRDTPLFVHPHFSIDQVSVPAAKRRQQ